MPQVFDAKTGEQVNVTPDQAAAGLMSGQLGLDADHGPVPLRDKTGRTVSVDPSKVSQALAGGYSLLSPEDELKEQVAREESAKGTLGSLEAAGSSAANQLLLGVPDAVNEAAMSPEDRAHQEAVNQYHGVARTLGGLAGFGGSMLYGGELFKGAELAGQAVEHAIVPAEQLAQAGLGVRMAAKAAGAATQTALLSTPQAVASAAFGDPNKAAETLLWGIGAGAALGGTGELLSSGAGAIGDGLKSILGNDKVRAGLDSFADRAAVKATGADVGSMTPDEVSAFGRTIDEEDLLRPGMSKSDLVEAIKTRHAEVGQQMSDAVSNLDSTIAPRAKDQAKIGAGFLTPTELADRVTAQFDGPEIRMPLNRDKAKALDDLVESIRKMPTTALDDGRQVISFKQANSLADTLREKWADSLEMSPDEMDSTDAIKANAYSLVQKSILQSANKVAAEAQNPGLMQQFASASSRYQDLARLEEAAQQGATQQAGNLFQQVKQSMAMGSGMFSGIGTGVGAAIGGAVGGPAGAMVGAMAGRLPGTVMNFIADKWVQDRGLGIASSFAKKAAKEGPDVFASVMASESGKRLTASMRTVRDAIDSLAKQGVARATPSDHMAHLLGSTSGLSKDQSYAKVGERLNTLTSNPAAIAETLGQLSSPFSLTAPDVATAYQQKMMQAITYLNSAFPKPPGPPAPFAPTNWSPQPTDKLGFHDKAEILVNPMRAMVHVKQGTLSDAHVDALKTLYPTIYAQMQNEILKWSADHPDVKLPSSERQSVLKFLGLPGDGLNSPDKVQALQSTYQQQGGSGPSQQTGNTKPPRGKLNPKNLPSQGTAFSSTVGASTLVGS